MDRPAALPTELLTSRDELVALCERLQNAAFVAVDTEFVRERTYYPRLCLVQIASDAALGLVDVLAIDDLSPLTELLQGETITKVLHAARQDLEIFFQLSGSVPAPVFDTQIAADLCGLGNQVGLASIADELLDVEIDKQHARADWSKRPLRGALLRYAADDVRHLVPIYDRLRMRLDELGRTAWLEEDCRRLLETDLYRVDADDAWRRVAGVRHLTGHRFHAARLIAAWRERRAMQLDRPRGWVLRDDAVIALAQAMPRDESALARLEHVPPAVRRKVGAQLVALIAEAATIDAPSPAAPQPLTAQQKKLVATGMDAVRGKARELNISSALLATRRDVTHLVRGGRNSVVLEGWRRPVIGERLLKISAG